MSRMITSGRSWAMMSAAAKGSPAVPMTSMSSLSSRSRLSVCLTDAESSTRRTLIFSLNLPPLSSYFFWYTEWATDRSGKSKVSIVSECPRKRVEPEPIAPTSFAMTLFWLARSK